MSDYNDSGLFSILPQLGFNPFEEMQGMTQVGLGNIIFPNGEAMFSWFKGFSENSLKGLGILGFLGKIKGPGSVLDVFNIGAPIGLPNLPGITKSGKGK